MMGLWKQGRNGGVAGFTRSGEEVAGAARDARAKLVAVAGAPRAETNGRLQGTCGGAWCLASLEDERNGGDQRWFINSRERDG